MVRSSNFPFNYVKKDKASLLIDDDQGETVSAQVVFDTDGSGTIGWVQYDIRTHQLFNTSVDPGSPERLLFDRRFAEEYERCITPALKQEPDNRISSYLGEAILGIT